MPLVSVIVPNYNHARYLPQRLDSILEQTYQDFDLILLDDCSTDNSREILEDYARRDDRIRCEFNATNSGTPFKQWNKGVGLAKGEYVWIAESDDFCEPSFLDQCVRKLDANPAVGIAYTDSYYFYDEDGRTESVAEEYLSLWDREYWASDHMVCGREECRRFGVIKNTIINASGAVFRKEIFTRAGGAEESMRLAGDWMTWGRMMLLCDVAYIAQPLNYNRVHGACVRHQESVRLRTVDDIVKIHTFLADELGLCGAERRRKAVACTVQALTWITRDGGVKGFIRALNRFCLEMPGLRSALLMHAPTALRIGLAALRRKTQSARRTSHVR